MGAALVIRRDVVEADALRRLARRERDRRTATRMLAIANALEGMTRAEAARLAGLERQALRDAVVRINAEGPAGLRDRPKSGRPPALSEGEQAMLRATVFRKPRLDEGGGDWTLPRLCAWIEQRFGKRLHPASLSRIVRGLDLSRQKTRPLHPRSDPRAQAAFAKKGLADAVTAAAAAHPDKKVTLWFMDEARVEQKGRSGHRWWLKGERPRGLCDRRFDWAYISAAVRPATGEDACLIMPEVSTSAMSTFLAAFAKALPPNQHAVLVLDRAGWHGAKALAVPDAATLVPLPPYSPELNPVERVWLYLRERFLSRRVLDGYGAIVDACCEAWNALTPERLRSLTNQPWIRKVAS